MYIFLLIFFFSRIFIYFEFVKNNLFYVEKNNYINENFLELLTFNHTIPNGHLLIEKLINLLGFNNSLSFYFLNISYTLIFCYFLNDISKKINLKKKFRIIILISISTILLPYESWRLDHHDHINLFLIAYLFWSIFYFINYKEKFNHIILSLVFLNLFYTLGFIYTFLTFFSILVFRRLINFKLDKFYYIKFFSVFVIIFSIFLKNYISVLIFSPTSMGGANLIQRTVHALGEEKYINFLESNKNKFPDWWIILTKEIINKNKKIDSENLRISNLAHGRLDRDIFLNYKKQKLIIENTNKIDKVIDSLLTKDLQNLNKSKWLYEIGYKQNLISINYQSYGNKIFIESCKMYPIEILIGSIGNKGIILTTIQMISYAGIFPFYYEINNRLNSSFVNYFTNLMRFLLIIILLLTPIVMTKKIKYKSISKLDFYYTTLIFFLSAITIVTSVITCCENPRMFVMQFFLICLICIFNLKYFIKIIKKSSK